MGKARGLHIPGRLVAAFATAAIVPAPAFATVFEVGVDGKIQVPGADSTITPDAKADSSTIAMPEAAPDVPLAAITTVAEPSVPADYRKPLLEASNRYNVSPKLLAALAKQESAWRPEVVSSRGAVGLTQLMPATARAMAVDPRDPSANLEGGARYLRQMLDRFDGDIERALAAYNAGPGRVVRSIGIPAIPQTRAYVTNIVDRLGIAAIGEGRK